MMKKVYICAPHGAESPEAMERIKEYAQFALRCGTAPVVPHFYTLCLPDATDRELRDTAGMSLLWFCDELWIFGDHVTKEMKKEIDFCKMLNIRTRKVNENEIDKKIGGKA